MKWRGRAAALAAAAGGTIVLTSLAGAHAADASAAPADSSADGADSEIKVTAAPLLVLTRQQWDESGKFSLGDFLQTLPEQGNAPNLQRNNGGVNYDADGATRINLRSLGVERTLVLVDGRRVVNSGLGASSSVDLNTVPDAAVDHVEVLTDGASALYGSGAVAGVVNIVTRRGFEGLEARANYGISDRGDGQTAEVNVLNGHSSDRASYLLTLSFHDQRPVYARDRSWSAQPLDYDFTSDPLDHDPNSRVVTVSGSSRVPQGAIVIPEDSFNPGSPAPGCLANALCSALVSSGWSPSQRFIRDPAAPLGWRPFTDADFYNFAAPNYLVTSTRRAQVFLDGDFRFDGVRAYYQAWYTWRDSEQNAAPIPLNPGDYGLVASAANVYNPFGADLPFVGRRLVEFGPRTYREEAGTYRLVAGLTGALDSAGPLTGWTWDVAANYGRSSGTFYTNGSFRNSRVAAAVGPSMLIGGVPSCVAILGDPGSAIDGCVPINLFGGPGSIDAAQIGYLGFKGKTSIEDSLLSLTGKLSGDLFSLPSGNKIRLAIGYEFRREEGAEIADPVIAAGDSADFNFASTRGSQSVQDVRTELTAPLIVDGPVIKLLAIDAAGDYAHHDTFGSVFSYRVGGQLAIGSTRLYGSYSRSYRAPDLRELFGGVDHTAAFVNDPCANFVLVSQGIEPQCLPTVGLQEIIVNQGGNPHVGPEKSETFTAGLTFAPRTVPGLSFNFNYYHLDVHDVIAPIGANTILARCYPLDGSQSDPQACALVVRGPVTGQIRDVDDISQSNGSLKTDGLDFEMRAHRQTSIGTLELDLNTTWIDSFTRTPDATLPTFLFTRRLINSQAIMGVGNFDLGAAPRLKANAELTWRRDGWGARLGARYVSSFKECSNLSDPTTAQGGLCYAGNPYSRWIPSYVVFDAQISRHFIRWSLGQTDFSVGVNNLFDRAPPFVYSAALANSDPTLYDFLGRFAYVRLTHTLEFTPFH